MENTQQNNNFSDLDAGQIVKVQHSDEYAAQRVVIVGLDGKDLNLNIDKLDIKMPEAKENQVIVKEIQLETIQIPHILIQKELQIVEIPTIVVQKEVQIVEVPILSIQKEIEYVEKQVIVPEFKILETIKYIETIKDKMPAWCWSIMISETLAIMILLGVLLKK